MQDENENQGRNKHSTYINDYVYVLADKDNYMFGYI